MTSPVFNPASPEAKVITDLFVVILILCGVILLIVTGLITYSLIRFRAKRGSPEPSQTVGNNYLEIAWTAIPLLLVFWISC